MRKEEKPSWMACMWN